MMKTIRSRMLAILIPIVIISLLASSSILYNVASEKISSYVMKQNDMEAQLLSNETGIWLGQFYTLIDMAAKTDSKTALDPKGKIALMAEMMKIDASVTDIYLGTAEGAMLDGSGWEPPADYDPRVRPWYASAIEAGQTAYSDPYLDLVTNKVVTSVSTPVFKPDGSVLGVLAADVQLGAVTDKINAIKIGEAGYAFIITQSGVIAAHPDNELIGKNGLTDLGDEIKKLTEAVIADEKGIHEYAYEGAGKIATFTTIPKTSWKLVVTIPKKELTKEVDELTFLILGSSAFFVLVTVLAVWIITGRITRPVVELNKITQKLSQGDLTHRANIKSETEIGTLANSFNLMADNIGELVGGITKLASDIHVVSNDMNKASEQTEDIAVQISHAAGDLAKGAEQQSDSVNESVKKVNLMAASIDVITESINSVYRLTESINEFIKQGESVIERQSRSMSENTQATNSVNEAIHLLDERTKEIGQIVGVIDGIASQTNLLALNASIEAARAGEQGRGFSVVADEIRKLAEQSTQSTSRIGDSIKEIVSRTQSAVDQAVVAENAVRAQEESVKQVVGIFKEIKSSLEEIRSEFVDVRSKTEGIKGEASVIRGSINVISNVIEMNAAGAEEVAASTEQQVNTLADVSRLAAKVEKLANDLRAAVDKFTL